MKDALSISELDVRPFLPSERSPQVFIFFDRLLPGEKFVLVNDHDPKPLLYQFAAERKREFSWFLLEDGPRVWRIEIWKRDPAYRRGIQHVLGEDHVRIDQIFFRFEETVRSANWLEALGRFSELRAGLKRHIRMEEEILFPELEKRKEAPGEVWQALWSDHQAIKKALAELGLSLAAAAQPGGDPNTPRQVRQKSKEFFASLQDHNAREERLLYRVLSHRLTEQQETQLLQKMEFL